MKKFYFLSLLFAFSTLSLAQVKIGNTNYPSLKAAFTAISTNMYANQHVVVEITANITETQTCLLAHNMSDPFYNTLTIKPTGAGSKTITFTGTGDALKFTDAHHVTIDGMNQLTIASPNTSNVLGFYGTSNVNIKNCKIMSGGTGIAVRESFWNSSITVKNYTIQNCDIGSYDAANSMEYGIKVSNLTGSRKENITVENNTIHDFGKMVEGGVAISVSEAIRVKVNNNRIYQSASHNSVINVGISVTNVWVQAAYDSEITGNEIGGMAMPVPGTSYEVCGGFVGIRYWSEHPSDPPIKIEGNAVRDIEMFGNDVGPMANSILTGIEVTQSNVIINNNTVGSLTGASFKHHSYNTGYTLVRGISVQGSVDPEQTNITVTNNFVGGIEALTPGSQIEADLSGINLSFNESTPMTCTGNTIGGNGAYSLRNDSQHVQSTISGLYVQGGRGPINENTVKNVIGYGSGIHSAAGIYRSFGISSSADNEVARNTVCNITAGHPTAATDAFGILQNSISSYIFFAPISQNFIYGVNSLSGNPSAEVTGIASEGYAAHIHNNMVALTGEMGAAEVNGIKFHYSKLGTADGTGYAYDNSVYVGGEKSSGNAPSRAFYILGSSPGAKFRIFNNIFVNNRTNAGSSTAKHYSIEIAAGYYFDSRIGGNVYYGTGNGYILGKTDVDKPTLQEFLKPAPHDDSGFVGNPQFLNPLASPPNLHINPLVPSIIEGSGTNGPAANVFTYLNTDYDNQSRPGLTPIDIGADAGNFTAILPPVISNVSATEVCANWHFEVTGTGLGQVTEAKIGNMVMAISSISDTSLTIETGNIALSGILKLTNPKGSTTYPNAITIYAPPVITQQPVSKTVCVTSATSFTVAVTGATSYQWRRNGLPISDDGTYSGTSTPTLNISFGLSGSYDVVMTGTANACTVVSSAAILTVNPSPLPVVSANGPTTICQNGSVTLSTNYNGPALQLDGANDYFDFPRQVTGDFTIEYWVKTTQTGGTGSNWFNGQGIVDATSGSVNDFGTSLLGSKLAFGVGNDVGLGGYFSTTIQSNTPINNGQWIHVAVTRSTSGQLQMYLNGVLDTVGATAFNAAIATPSIRVGGKQNGGNFFNGAIDDIRVWPYVRTQNQIRSAMSHSLPVGSAGLINNFTLNENGGFNVTNVATGQQFSLPNGGSWTNRSTTSNYQAYQWSNGATTPTINVNTTGNYSVMVTDANGCSGYSSIPATVTVQNINVSPTATTVCQGSPTTLTASGAVSYSWSPPTGLNTTVGASVIATPATTTTYTVTGQMTGGCISTKQVTVTVNTTTVSASQLFIAPGGSTTLTASGSTGYTWSPASGLSATTGASVIATPTQTTTYTVTPQTCSGNTKTITITVLPMPSAGDNALDFDGADDYVSIPVQSVAVTGNFTVEAWIKPTHPTKRMHIFSTRNGADNSFDIQIENGTTIHGDIGNGSAWLTTAADATFNYSANTWMHIAYVVTPTGYSIYANGNLVGSGAFSGTPVLYSGSRFITIGKNTVESSFFQGTMDDIRIYNTALTETQIQSDMDGSFQTSGLLAYYNCDEGIAGGNNTGITTLIDQNMAGNFHGTLHTFALSGSTSNWVEGTAAPVQGQVIDFGPLDEVVYGSDNFGLTATASSGLPITYESSDPSVASISGNTVVINGAGTVQLTATQGGNGTYMPATPVAQFLTITPKPITITEIMVSDKVYDRNNSAILAGGTFEGIVGSDEVFISVGATFATSDVGNDIPVMANAILDGAQSGNYILIQPTGLSADITPKPVTLSDPAFADWKTYDGTAAATIFTLATLSGVISPDEVAIASYAGVYDFATPGDFIPVTAQMTLGGAQANNYVMEQPTGLWGHISPKTLTVADAVANDKLYDGTTATTINGTLTGVISPDDVIIASNAGAFDSATAGNDIPVNGQMTLGGSSAGNYTLEQPTGLSADIIAPVVLFGIFNGTTTICLGHSTPLSVTISGGIGPFTVAYTNGSQTFTVSNYVGSPGTELEFAL